MNTREFKTGSFVRGTSNYSKGHKLTGSHEENFDCERRRGVEYPDVERRLIVAVVRVAASRIALFEVVACLEVPWHVLTPRLEVQLRT